MMPPLLRATPPRVSRARHAVAMAVPAIRGTAMQARFASSVHRPSDTTMNPGNSSAPSRSSAPSKHSLVLTTPPAINSLSPQPIATSQQRWASTVPEQPRMYTTSFAFFEALWEAGVTHVFVNLGSDHPSIIEAMVKGAREKKGQFPRIITCPNEVANTPPPPVDAAYVDISRWSQCPWPTATRASPTSPRR